MTRPGQPDHGSAGPRVVAVVAARNEEATIGDVVAALAGIPRVDEVVVSCGGSGDRTADLARAAGATVIEAPTNGGKGGAVEAAIDSVAPGDIYLLVDGDVGHTAAETEALLAPLVAARADLCIGRLPELGGGGFGLVKRLAGCAIAALSGFRPSEPLSGQRAVRREALRVCRPLARGFGLEAAMTVDVTRLGYRVVEVPVRMTHRPTGRGVAGFAHRGRQGLDILRALLPRALGLR